MLCGVRDIKEYRIHTSGKEIITGGSCFNIKTKSLRLANFSKEDIINLYEQHTEATGQKFSEDCYDLIMELTDGQPWLVNSIAREVTHEMKENRDRSIVITPEMILIAKETLIQTRQTHLDQLVDKLKEERVQRVIRPMIMGGEEQRNEDDVAYCIDLGLVRRSKAGLVISNKIYQEIIPRVLNSDLQDDFIAVYKNEALWMNKDGSINVKSMLTLFKDFWNENGAIWGDRISGYLEAAPQLVLQAFLQRVVNCGGTINREYALASRRTDLLIKWWYETPPDPLLKKGEVLVVQNIVMEIKTISEGQKYETVKKEALVQTARYSKICGVHEAQILVFDRKRSQNWDADIENEYAEYDGVKMEIWRLAGS
jgi:hypothetical protein